MVHILFSQRGGRIVSSMADDEKKDYDLLLFLRRSICESLKAIEGLEQRRITLKLNKKLSWADFIVPALTRTCVGDPPGLGEDVS